MSIREPTLEVRNVLRSVCVTQCNRVDLHLGRKPILHFYCAVILIGLLCCDIMALMSCSSAITPGYAVAQWLGIRLQMLGVAMVVGVAFIAILEHHFSTVDPGTWSLGNYLLPTLCGFPLSTMYSGNFQERKLSQISRSCGYSRKFSL